jgi:peptide/nickel transport system permease protein
VSLPQTLWVVGSSYIIGILIGMPLGIISAYKQYSVIDQGATFFSMVGFSIPTFFTGTMAIIIFSVWTPTTPGGGYHRVTTPRM